MIGSSLTLGKLRMILNIQTAADCQPSDQVGARGLDGAGCCEFSSEYERVCGELLILLENQQFATHISQCKPRHRHQEFLSFLKHLDANIPAELELHLIADNYATHKHPKVKAWLASHSRFHLHFTPTYSSWLNQVERWFALITQQAIRRGSFRNVRELVGKIDAYVAHYNTHKRPFVWTATANSIFDKLQRICKLINGTRH